MKGFTYVAHWQNSSTKLIGETPQDMRQFSNSYYHLLTKWLLWVTMVTNNGSCFPMFGPYHPVRYHRVFVNCT